MYSPEVVKTPISNVFAGLEGELLVGQIDVASSVNGLEKEVNEERVPGQGHNQTDYG